MIAAILVLLGASAVPGQDPQQQGMMMPPPPELKALWWLKGEWDADLKMYEPGSTTPMTMKGTVTCGEALGGMWLESRHQADMNGMPMQGLQLTSYDATKKQYMAYWYDSMGPGALELWGTVKGQTLILVSKPFTMPGMKDAMVFRSTNSLKGPGKMLFRLEMAMGKQPFGVMMEGMMTRKGG